MVKLSARAAVTVHKMVDATDEEAMGQFKERMRAAAMQVALDMRRDGYIVDLEVDYLVAYEVPKNV